MGYQLNKTLFLLFALGVISSTKAQDTPNWQADKLIGDWGGMRTSLSGKGVTLALIHKSDLLSNTSGHPEGFCLAGQEPLPLFNIMFSTAINSGIPTVRMLVALPV